jgi:hypothetical protein
VLLITGPPTVRFHELAAVEPHFGATLNLAFGIASLELFVFCMKGCEKIHG